MRIEAYSQIQQVYGTGKVNRTAKTEKTNSVSDTLKISSIGKDIQIAKKAVSAAPDIREDKVNAMKAALAGGYTVSDNDLADKLLESFAI
jgi:negative regulator of flagellin synthesis FlgM